MQSLITEMTYSFLTELVDTSMSGDIEKIVEMGVTQEQANAVASLPIKELHSLSRRNNVINTEFDENLLRKAVREAQAGVRLQRDIPRLHITNQLMNRLSDAVGEASMIPVISQKTGLSEKTLLEIGKLNAIDILAIGRTGIVFYEITANPYHFSAALEYLLQELNEERDVEYLIAADASYSMVKSLTGMSKNAFIKYRKSLKMPSCAGGAPKQLTTDQEHNLYRVWKNTTGERPIKRALRLYEALNGFSLRHLWPHIEKMMEDESQEKPVRNAMQQRSKRDISEDEIRNLIRTYGSYRMLKVLTGISRNQYKKLRAEEGIISDGGSRERLTDEMYKKVVKLYTKKTELDMIEKCLAIHNALGGEPMKNVWPVIEDLIKAEQYQQTEPAQYPVFDCA